MTISRCFRRIRNVSNNSCRQNQHTHFMFTDFLSGDRAVYENVEKYYEARENADNMAPARDILEK